MDLPGSNLLQTLSMPCNMTLTQSYEEKRDLLIGQLYKRSNTSVASRTYTYDTLGRPVTRSTSKDGSTVNDTFGYNSRSELNTAMVNNEAYAYDYDNIGNRETAQEAAESATSYESNQLNQYTAIGDFEPSYDDAGNQTKVKTSTGIWSVVYNAENRPTSFTNADSGTIVECSYDYMGRRATKKVTVNGSVTLHQRFLYRGYLQIACCDLARSNHPSLWLITWDPSQPVATRPLAIQKDGTWYTYGWDLTKNICEVYGQYGYIRTNYSYSPFGEVMANGDVAQPIQWSSEYNDAELALVYYNYRYYNYTSGNWLNRDMSVNDEYNLYLYVRNRSIDRWDAYGLFLDFLRNSKGELPSFTFELSSPVPVWGGYPFGVIEIGLPKKDWSQDITIAAGINWQRPNFLNKFLPEEITNKIPKMDISGFLEGKGTYKCGCFSFCEISFGVAGVFGDGRRGGHSGGDKDLRGLETKYGGSAGGSFEVRGTVDLCKGEFNGTFTFVVTIGFKAPGFAVFGYGINPSFEVSVSEEGNLWSIPIPELKLFKPCA